MSLTMPTTYESPETPPGHCTCTWAVHVNFEADRQKDGQFPRTWELKVPHRACRYQSHAARSSRL